MKESLVFLTMVNARCRLCYRRQTVTSVMLSPVLLVTVVVVVVSHGWLIAVTPCRRTSTPPSAILLPLLPSSSAHALLHKNSARIRTTTQQLLLFHAADEEMVARRHDEDDDEGKQQQQVVVNGDHPMPKQSSSGGAGSKDPTAVVDYYELRFGGVGRLYSSSSKQNNKSGDSSSGSDEQQEESLRMTTILNRFKNAAVLVVGMGGVGSWAAEALCRSGIGTLVLIDLDDICISNTNRQLHATSKTVGQMKVDVMRERLLSINNECKVRAIHEFVTADNVHEIFDSVQQQLGNETPITAVVDAIDTAKEKAAILAACDERGIPVVTCGGAAGRKDPSKIMAQDLTLIKNDKLLATCKKHLRKRYRFQAGLPFRELQKGKKVKPWKIQGVFSEELVVEQQQQQDTTHHHQLINSSLRKCDGGALGTACFVTGTFGFVAAAVIVDAIANDKLRIPRGRRR